MKTLKQAATSLIAILVLVALALPAFAGGGTGGGTTVPTGIRGEAYFLAAGPVMFMQISPVTYDRADPSLDHFQVTLATDLKGSELRNLTVFRYQPIFNDMTRYETLDQIRLDYVETRVAGSGSNVADYLLLGKGATPETLVERTKTEARKISLIEDWSIKPVGNPVFDTRTRIGRMVIALRDGGNLRLLPITSDNRAFWIYARLPHNQWTRVWFRYTDQQQVPLKGESLQTLDYLFLEFPNGKG